MQYERRGFGKMAPEDTSLAVLQQESHHRRGEYQQSPIDEGNRQNACQSDNSRVGLQCALYIPFMIELV